MVVKSDGSEAHSALRDMQQSKWKTLPREAAFNFLKVTSMPKANIQREGRITEAQLDFTINSCFDSTTFEQKAQKYGVGDESCHDSCSSHCPK